MEMQEMAVLPAPISIMGGKVTPFTSYTQAVACVEDRLGRKQKSFCVAINPEKVYRASRDNELNKILAKADMGLCDGVGISIAARLIYGKKIRRCTGVDLFYELIAKAAERQWKVFLLGASPMVNEKACKVLCDRYAGLQVAGRCDGYFENSAAVVDQINASGADLVFVAMGTPRQEYWIAEISSKINAGVLMGVGGTFDVVSGMVRRAPLIFRRTGTEFLYRLISNPRRWRRQMVLPLFFISVLIHRYRLRRRRMKQSHENVYGKQG